MSSTREDLRDHLTAVIEAAQELPREDRSYLADNFLDQLETQYQLIPRSEQVPVTERSTRWSGFSRPTFDGWPLPLALMILLPALVVSLFVLAHPPIFLVVLVTFLLFRVGRNGRRRGGRWGIDPRPYGTARYHR